MADAQVLYAEDVSGTTANSTAWVDLCTISAASFTAGKTYLILANTVVSNGNATNESRVRLVHGTTPTVFDDASLAWEGLASDTQQHEMSYMFQYTQPGTAELVKLQISCSSTSVARCQMAQILAIKLSDDFTSGTDYHWNEVTANYTITTTPTAQAITASFTPNGTDRWLFIGHMIYDVVSITDEIGFELYDSVAGVLADMQEEGEDATNDFKSANLYWVGVPTNASRTVTVRPHNEGGSNVALATRVFAINLSKFQNNAGTFDASAQALAATPTYTTMATVSPTPTATGNFVYIGFMVNDVGTTTDDVETRLQVNPSGGGLVDDPAYASTAPSIDNWDALDLTAFSVFNLTSLTSGAARPINYDGRMAAGTTMRAVYRGLAAFSVALTPAGTEASDNQIAYLKGQDTASDNQIAYTRGKDTSSDNQIAYLAGRDTASDNQSAYTRGTDTASDNQPAYLAGGLAASDNQPAYLYGQDVASDNQIAYLRGTDTAADNQPAYLSGVLGASDNQTAYLRGQDSASDNQTAYARGQDAAADNQIAYLRGQDQAADNQIAYLAGQDTASDNQPAYLNGAVTGAQASDNQTAYLHGEGVSSDAQSAYLSGSLQAADTQAVYLRGQASTSDSQPAYLFGLSAGASIASSSQNAYLFAVALQTSERRIVKVNLEDRGSKVPRSGEIIVPSESRIVTPP